jgi:very-short-patch-repair endonuclease
VRASRRVDQHLIVELDGGQHADRLKDGQRHSELCALSYREIRFWNSDVIDNLDGISKRSSPNSKNDPSPHPLPACGRKRGEGDGEAGGRLF